MDNNTIFVVTEQNLTSNYGTSVTAFKTLDKAREYVRGIIEEYNVDGTEIINDDLNWYDEELNYFDILITVTNVV